MLATTGKVLLVEDNEDNRIVFATVLRYFGYEVEQALTGDEGLEMAQKHPPDVILMDISMPGLDGYELTRRLRSTKSTESIPIIALTAHALASDRRRAFEAGCNDFIAKPCEPRVVVDAVGRWLRRSRGAQFTEDLPPVA